MQKITTVIITLNEGRNIERCIRSVLPVTDEVVVVDSGSTDRTADICRQYEVVFVQRGWQGYAAAKNYGNSLASHDYILSIDADEELSEELAQSILSHKQHLQGLYSFNRLTNYCGRWIRHCGWYPDEKIRLFDRRNARWEGGYVHEALVADQQIPRTKLAGDLYHYSFQSISDHVEKIHSYSTLAAKKMHDGRRRSSLVNLLAGPPIVFLQKYLFQQGWRDGFEGFVISLLSAYDKTLRLLKLMELERNERMVREPQ
jgi:glycosyltransferase involved in cell wall biosynthesis